MSRNNFTLCQYIADTHDSDWIEKVEEMHRLRLESKHRTILAEGLETPTLRWLDAMRVSQGYSRYTNKMLMVIGEDYGFLHAVSLYDGHILTFYAFEMVD